MTTSLQISDIPDEILEALRERAAKRHISLAAYVREVLIREAGHATMEETLARPRVIRGRRLRASEVKLLIGSGRV